MYNCMEINNIAMKTFENWNITFGTRETKSFCKGIIEISDIYHWEMAYNGYDLTFFKFFFFINT